eukprot:TRINITY_DN9881_c0_g1_i1.p1 TRINITY_DN9881_c0_g1~~TRINITY_DN9881_c0_g1_i1.p1  ORF type:complete len:204 (+),score=16.13 TRINITY_DN9881_c0_g1_i1:152-763(+)
MATKKTERTWEEMLDDLKAALAADTADIDELKGILSSYKSQEEDWSKYALFDSHCYTRNLVDDGNGKYNIMLLCWNMGQASSIHSHAGSHCFMKLLDGSLVEELYEPPSEVQEGQAMEPQVETANPRDGVIYISDEIGMHRVVNPSHAHSAVSLHIYSPPYSECLCFDERTGKSRSSGAITFYSKGGEIVDETWKSGMGSDYC